MLSFGEKHDAEQTDDRNTFLHGQLSSLALVDEEAISMKFLCQDDGFGFTLVNNVG